MSNHGIEGMILVDIETTGLEPNLGVVLELGMVRCDTNFEIVDSFSSVVYGDNEHDFVTRVWREDDYAYGMHKKSGLLQAVHDIGHAVEELSVGEVEWAAISWLQKQGVNTSNHSEPMAGSSVHFDRKWLEYHMPRLAECFGYRNIDASSFMEYSKKFFPTYANKVDESIKRTNAHRPIPDLIDTLALFSGLRQAKLIG